MYGNLRIFRESLGMTQKEFAASLSIGLTTYNGYETGARDPKSDFWISVATKYHVTVDYLMGFSDNPNKISDAIKKFTPYSDEAMKLAADYDDLDGHGQRVVRVVADEEKARCEEERKDKKEKAAILNEVKADMEVAEEIACFILPYYLHPSSAGTGEYSIGDEWEELTMTKRPPRGASYVVRVHGDSMEPTFHDGDKVFVRAGAEVMPGQIGIFIMEREQYIKELGTGELISHNPNYDPKPMTDDAYCQGLVLGVCDDSYFE